MRLVYATPTSSFLFVSLFTTHTQPPSLPPLPPHPSLRPSIPPSNLLALLPVPGGRHTRNVIVLRQHRQVLIKLIDALPMALAHQVLDILLLPLLLPSDVPALRLGQPVVFLQGRCSRGSSSLPSFPRNLLPILAVILVVVRRAGRGDCELVVRALLPGTLLLLLSVRGVGGCGVRCWCDACVWGGDDPDGREEDGCSLEVRRERLEPPLLSHGDRHISVTVWRIH